MLKPAVLLYAVPKGSSGLEKEKATIVCVDHLAVYIAPRFGVADRHRSRLG
jgi:hypothetical protein